RQRMIRRQLPAHPIRGDIEAMPHPEVATQGLTAKPTLKTNDMVLLNRSPDRHRRTARFCGGFRPSHAEATQRTMRRCDERSELFGSDLVLRDVIANDGDHEGEIELLRDAFLGHFPTKRLLDPNMDEITFVFKSADRLCLERPQPRSESNYSNITLFGLSRFAAVPRRGGLTFSSCIPPFAAVTLEDGALSTPWRRAMAMGFLSLCQWLKGD